MVFLENTTLSRAEGASRLAKLAALRGSSSGWACVLLALLGIGGGLAMAFLSFNSSEAPSARVAAVPQEIIYLPPSGGASDESSFAARLAGAVELAAPAPARTEDSFTDLQAFTAPTLGGEARERGGYERTVGSFDSSAASVAALNGGEPGNTIGSFANGGGGGNEAAFSGVLAPIPEPSTWAMMLSGAGVLFAVLPRRKRRE